MKPLNFKFKKFLKRILFEYSNWRIKAILMLVLFKLIGSYGKEQLITQNMTNNGINLNMKELQENQYYGTLNNYNLTMPVKEEKKSDLNDYKNSSQRLDKAIETKGLMELGYKNFNDTFQFENLTIYNPKTLLNETNNLNITENENNTTYKPLIGRKMAEYELIHRDQVVFRPVGYHQFDVIPQVIHQMPQHQYPMFRSGYLGYPYNPINYYRSPYITAIKRNRTRRLFSEDLDTNMENGYKVEYEIIEFLNENNNSIFNH